MANAEFKTAKTDDCLKIFNLTATFEILFLESSNSFLFDLSTTTNEPPFVSGLKVSPLYLTRLWDVY